MGYEKSEPRNRVILISGVVSALTLAGLVPVFHGYFDAVYHGEQSHKVDAGSSERDSIADKEALVDGAPTSIDDAADAVAAGRRGVTRTVPTDSFSTSETEALASLAPVKGWAARERVREENSAREALLRRRAREQARRAAAAAAAIELDPVGNR